MQFKIKHLALILSAFVLLADTAMPAAAGAVEYHGIAPTADGRWSGFITNKNKLSIEVGHFDTAEAAALAQDRAILAILGPGANPELLNFRAAFSDTELRFLKGRHAPPRNADVIRMLLNGTYDAELARFAERAFDAYLDPELALDVMNFRFVHADELNRRKAAAVDAASRDNVERDLFLEAVRNKATDGEWVRSFLRRRQLEGPTFEDENRWPTVLPPINVDLGDNYEGNELLYLPHGSWYVDEMVVV